MYCNIKSKKRFLNVTGFGIFHCAKIKQKLFCFFHSSPPDETDGPPGAIALATMLLSLGKKVTMITDRRALEMNKAIIDKAVETGRILGGFYRPVSIFFLQ